MDLKMDVNESQDLLKRSSLGRIAFIGELYDVRNESLSSLSLLNATFPQDLVKGTGSDHMVFRYGFTENSSERFKLVNVEPELQLSLLLGLVKAEGSGKFFKEEKTSEKTISCSLMCQIQTQNEKVFASLEDLLSHVDMKVLENPKYTHVVTEINWGVNCFLNLEFAGGSECEKEDKQGRLAAELANVKVIAKGGGQLEASNVKSNFLSDSTVDIKVFADIVPEGGLPTTVEGFFSFVKDVPKLLKKVNDGKGKPLNYTMVPLRHLRRMAKLDVHLNATVVKIDVSFFISTLNFFDEVGQVKQKMHDSCALLKDKRKYVEEDDLKAAEQAKAELILKESELKSLISTALVSVRSGERTLKDLMTEVENFQKDKLNLLIYKEHLNSLSSVVQELSMVSDLVSRGLLYLGRGEKFESLIPLHPSSEFVVLVKSSETERADPELHRRTLCHFLTLVSEARPGVKYVLADIDLTGETNVLGVGVDTSKIFRLKGGEILSQDVLAEYLEEKGTAWVRLRGGLTMELCRHKPGNRVVLEMTCPGQSDPDRNCSTDELSWQCFACGSKVEYGFDKFYYCSCGRSPADRFEYRCVDDSHGAAFIPASEAFLEKALSKLRPLKEMNVLVIGQSGVGKSTWINSIINYFSYDSLEDAMNNGVICTIPTKFTVCNPETFEEEVIEIRGESQDERMETGGSATQYASTYTFPWKDRCVRIIDTPGLADTRGIEQDKKNLTYIIDHLGYLEEIHGVCVLVKANENRITAIFSYCLKELLVHLHKRVTRNIVFCFTNSRTSMYTPGSSVSLLRKVFKEMKLEKILALGKNNMFCLDNEVFPFLCSWTLTNFKHSEMIMSAYRQSWNTSQSETKRLFSTIETFEPHLLEETLSLVKARERVLSLAKPIAEITKTIQLNISALERKQKDIETSDLTVQELLKKVNLTEICLEVKPLEMPRTVCTNPSCVEHITSRIKDYTEIEYKSHCHSGCRAFFVSPSVSNSIFLWFCCAFNYDGTCKKCGCHWRAHMHLTYDQTRVEKTVVNERIKQELDKEESENEKLKILVKNLRETVKNYEEEQKTIVKAAVKFGNFLRRNAISVYNDSVAAYLEYLIDVEEKKPHKNKTDEKLLQKLKETLKCYEAEVEIFKELEKTHENQEELKPEQLFQIEEELYRLKLTGEQIRESVAICRWGSYSARRYNELLVPSSSSKDGRELLPVLKGSSSKSIIRSLGERVLKIFL